MCIARISCMNSLLTVFQRGEPVAFHPMTAHLGGLGALSVLFQHSYERVKCIHDRFKWKRLSYGRRC